MVQAPSARCAERRFGICGSVDGKKRITPELIDQREMIKKYLDEHHLNLYQCLSMLYFKKNNTITYLNLQDALKVGGFGIDKNIQKAILDYSLNELPQDVAESYLNIIFYELKDHFVSNRMYSDLTTSVFRYIHENPAGDLTVAGIADALIININHLIRTFKKDTGLTPLKYIGLMKSELAVSYIRKGHSLEDIAELLGYSTVSALSVAFKNVTHKNLSEFR